MVRYSSFVDLMRVAYANGVSLVLALVVSWMAEKENIEALSALNRKQTVITFLVSTLLMGAVRVVVKTLYDVMTSKKLAQRALIYGAQTGGIGIAKNIRSQNPRQFILRGFISHDPQTKHFRLMGEKVHNTGDDIAAIIEKDKIEAVLVSPLRVDDFRNNQTLQDILIKAGVKIYMAQQAKEAFIKNGKLVEDSFQNVQMNEVSVEDLLPRSEINVDMDSAGAMLMRKRVMITGSAGSIGSEMVRQIAIYNPAMMILIDQAETPQHDVMLMTDKFPDIKTEVIVTSIGHEHRMERIFKEYQPDYVFHAAAYKHVPMMENNPSEAVLNNIHGTKVIADLSVK